MLPIIVSAQAYMALPYLLSRNPIHRQPALPPTAWQYENYYTLGERVYHHGELWVSTHEWQRGEVPGIPGTHWRKVEKRRFLWFTLPDKR